ncbi:MAG: HAMP domain-containing histidine kinase [Saprospiraceae bacterium]|nr:HAMP domain-containing histidine kinase [Saprospiraceae bacterium]
MKIYTRKRQWKWFLLASAILIVSVSLWYTNILVKKIAADEREKVKIWANAIQRKANLVNYTEEFFKKIREEERRRVELWAKAYRYMIEADDNQQLNLYLEIITGNKNIPVILTDVNDKISNSVNVEINLDSIEYLEGSLKEEFTEYDPIVLNYGQIIYYKESKLFTELRDVLNDLTESFFSEIVHNSSSAPVIVTDSTKKKVITFGNIDSTLISDSVYVEELMKDMKFENKPIEIQLANHGKRFIFYKDSFLLTQLRYYPIAQFIVIGLFLLVAYILFSIARKSEQNQVWVGMAKETAHQLGTPLSSMMAWIEMLKLKNVDEKTVAEITKDVSRLEIITDRFSKIGSTPKLIEENLVTVIQDSVSYNKARTTKKIDYQINTNGKQEIIIPINLHLFEWVIENLFKNALDAMSGSGKINVELIENKKEVFIDISDTGKGISKRQFKTIFNPGYTSKQRGWGLGLSLAERIVENYHNGKIFVKSSAINQGTVFRIILKK